MADKMLDRLLSLPLNHSFFLFGPRGAGKSTLLHQVFAPEKTLWLDLLNADLESHFTRHPMELEKAVLALPETVSHVVIDEIQKCPKLLDVVHSLIEKTNKKFILTGSSARKLKYGGANLLAGRAFVYHLFPFASKELQDQFDLEQVLPFGLLPKLFQYTENTERQQFLQAYALTYLKEEIWAEQLVKNLDVFRRFLEVAAPCNGKIINFSNIAEDVGSNANTIKEYFSLLEDTLIGFFLEPFQHSFRKRLSAKPKFYFFDTGVTRALNRQLSLPLLPQTSVFGEVFEHFVILEIYKLIHYYKNDYRMSYLMTKDDVEIDVILERPGLPLLCIEIKSTTEVKESTIKQFKKITQDLMPCEAVCLSLDPLAKKYDHVYALPWKQLYAWFDQ